MNCPCLTLQPFNPFRFLAFSVVLLLGRVAARIPYVSHKKCETPKVMVNIPKPKSAIKEVGTKVTGWVFPRRLQASVGQSG